MTLVCRLRAIDRSMISKERTPGAAKVGKKRKRKEEEKRKEKVSAFVSWSVYQTFLSKHFWKWDKNRDLLPKILLFPDLAQLSISIFGRRKLTILASLQANQSELSVGSRPMDQAL